MEGEGAFVRKGLRKLEGWIEKVEEVLCSVYLEATMLLWFCRGWGHNQLRALLWNGLDKQRYVTFDMIEVPPSICYSRYIQNLA